MFTLEFFKTNTLFEQTWWLVYLVSINMVIVLLNRTIILDIRVLANMTEQQIGRNCWRHKCLNNKMSKEFI